jgi:Flp pilus assembly protein TadG
MSKIIRNVKKKFARMERGQVLVLVALAAVGIIAIIGLVMDVGVMFIENARLRRAVDAAALSAALQYRQGYTLPGLTRAANEFLVLNGLNNPNSTVSSCTNDATLCTTPPRKLVKVHATADVKLAFLPVIGIDNVPISATAVSETASLDVVLVIDRSESMTYDAPAGDPDRDPAYCNANPVTLHGHVQASSCSPFQDVIDAAIQFTEGLLFFPYDNAAVVTFDKNPHLDLTLSSGNSSSAVVDVLRNLTVYEGEGIYKNASSSVEDYRCYGQANSCIGTPADICQDTPDYTGGVSNYKALLGKGQDPCLPGYVNPPDPSHYTTTNIGGGLLLAGNEFATDSRQQALWVVILLTDGVANAGYNDDATLYHCPESTWGNQSLSPSQPLCNDLDVASYATHALRPASNSTAYDASDYAYDMADFVGLDANHGGQFALMYTIGLGPELTRYTTSYADPYSYPLPGVTGEGLGKVFLNYAAGIGRGQAFYAASGSELNKIFRLIGTNIATRLSQ